MQVLLFDRLVSPPNDEPVRMRMSICGHGQRAFQNRYIFHPDNERKVRRYSVFGSQLNTNVRKFNPDHASLPHPFSSGSLSTIVSPCCAHPFTTVLSGSAENSCKGAALAESWIALFYDNINGISTTDVQMVCTENDSTSEFSQYVEFSLIKSEGEICVTWVDVGLIDICRRRPIWILIVAWWGQHRHPLCTFDEMNTIVCNPEEGDTHSLLPGWNLLLHTATTLLHSVLTNAQYFSAVHVMCDS